MCLLLLLVKKKIKPIPLTGTGFSRGSTLVGSYGPPQFFLRLYLLLYSFPPDNSKAPSEELLYRLSPDPALF